MEGFCPLLAHRFCIIKSPAFLEDRISLLVRQVAHHYASKHSINKIKTYFTKQHCRPAFAPPCITRSNVAQIVITENLCFGKKSNTPAVVKVRGVFYLHYATWTTKEKREREPEGCVAAVPISVSARHSVARSAHACLCT